MTAIKEKIIDAVTVMSDNDAEMFWNIINQQFKSVDWENIEEIEPDDIDLQMLKAIEDDPECHEFTNEKDIDWEKI